RLSSDTDTTPVLAWLYVVDAWEGGIPSARYLGVMADAAEIAGAPAEYIHDIRTRPARNIGPGT
ncbi:MAG TPA: gamma-glutamylcyclotransferase, partial [Mycobacterium sp.]|nr:gamma-glutamylcyclotransferase [Mycobacterium sp.]